MKCAHCGSRSCQAETDLILCVDCGGYTSFSGEAVRKKKSGRV